MPPSPSLRYSPGKGVRGDSHKRGRSLESGLSFKEKDDDLALFNEMQNKEQEDFLLQPADDFGDILSSKLKTFPDLKLGIAIPARGESSDLLNIDGDKNDYDWLLTPPDTPLFPSLDDEAPPANLVYSGRPRSRPVSISRSSTMGKSYRTGRGSASPQRLSQSPCSSTSATFQSRGRPSSDPRSSPSPSLRHSTPTRRPSPPPVKPSTPTPRSSTSTPRRSSTGSVAALSSGVRGPSPVRSSRGTSSSPKIRAWQSNIPGFSLEAPPNLRTSLADRPASYVRGSSPASRNSRDSSSKFRRQSMSPTATRSISSSHSHERDQFSSHSKGSVASSGDDEADSLLSAPLRGSDHSASQRGVGGYPSNRPIAFSKKPTKTFYPSSAPKRSFDSAIRQMDKKTPQNMFRPLLSSVPSTTFYAGKASSSHRVMMSINSSLTTSSNASSDQVTSGAPDTEGSEHNQDDVDSECGRAPYTDVHDEIFAFDKMDAVSEDTQLDSHDHLSDAQPDEYHKVSAFGSKPGETREFHRHGATGLSGANSEGHQEVYVDGVTLCCSRCGCSYKVSGLMEDDMNLCPECKQKEEVVVNPISSSIVDVPPSSSVPSANISEEVGSSYASEPYLAAAFSVMEVGESVTELQIVPDEENARETRTSYELLSKSSLDNSYAEPEGDTSAPMISDVQISEPPIVTPDQSTDGIHELHSSIDGPLTKIDATEGAGISVLLSNRPRSSKGPVIQGRNFTATAVSYDVRSYTRESTSMRSSIGYGSVSTSSSVDMSSRHTEMPMQRQFSGKKSDISSKPESIGSSFSRTSSYISQGLALAVSTHEENFDSYDGNGGKTVTEGPETPPGPAVALENVETLDTEASFAHLTLFEEDDLHENSRANDSPSIELPTDVGGRRSILSTTDVIQLEVSSSLQLPDDEEHNLHVIDNQLPVEVQINDDINDSAAIPESSLNEDSVSHYDGVNQLEVSEASQGDLATMPEIETHDCYVDSQKSGASGDVSEEPLATPLEAKDSSVSDSLRNDPEVNIVHGKLDEPTVIMDYQEGTHVRSLTLEEATDTILFCSSIIHDLAYKAASIGIEKEKENLAPLDRLMPTVTSADKPGSDRDMHSRSTTKQTSKGHKIKRRRKEMEANLPSTKTETIDDESVESTFRNVGLPHKVDSMKPPKLESKCNCTIM